uniref:Uncharacterized protein n=1 Tax=Arundo donax TaxID=35708 RepID=A0A0A8ZBX9_ARUDO
MPMVQSCHAMAVHASVIAYATSPFLYPCISPVSVRHSPEANSPATDTHAAAALLQNCISSTMYSVSLLSTSSNASCIRDRIREKSADADSVSANPAGTSLPVASEPWLTPMSAAEKVSRTTELSTSTLNFSLLRK